MNKRSVRVTVLILSVLSLMAGCLTDGGDDSNDNGDAAGGANVPLDIYMPLIPGSIYHYRSATFYPQSEKPSEGDYKTYIGNSVPYGGKTYFQVFDQYTGWSDTTLVRTVDNTMYMLGSFWYLSAKQAYETERPVQKRAGADAEVIEIPYLRFDTDAWTLFTGSVSGTNFTLSINWTGAFVGKQSVNSTAGMFKDCVLFELTLQEDGTYTNFEVPLSNTRVTRVTYWYAAGVGVVKILSTTETSTNGSELKLDETSVTELTAYHIP